MKSYLLPIYFSYLVLAQQCPSNIQIQVALSSRICNFGFVINNTLCRFDKCSYFQTSKAQPKYYGLAECYNQCCLDLNTLTDSNVPTQILNCQIENNKKSIIFKIFLAILISLVVGAVIILVICLNKPSCPLYRQPKDNKNSREIPKQNKQITLQELFASKILPFQLNNKKQHQYDLSSNQYIEALTIKNSTQKINSSEKKNIKLLQQKCYVCRQIKPTCSLSCEHCYHINCLGSYLLANNSLPPCNHNIKIIRIYCQDCLKEISYYSIHKFKSKLRKNHSFYCLTCKSHQRQKLHEFTEDKSKNIF